MGVTERARNAGRTDGRMDGVKPIYPQQLRCARGIINGCAPITHCSLGILYCLSYLHIDFWPIVLIIACGLATENEVLRRYSEKCWRICIDIYIFKTIFRCGAAALHFCYKASFAENARISHKPRYQFHTFLLDWLTDQWNVTHFIMGLWVSILVCR